jgi:hypothetical protein
MTTTTNTNGTITAFPLSWPASWKRTPDHSRARAKFNTSTARNQYGYRGKREVTITEAIERVLHELRGFGVSRENAIISTNLDVRLDGLPRSGQRAPDDPGAAVYWTRNANERQRCMAIDQYDRLADNLAAIAATLGAMRAIERHGGAEILDRAFEGFAALPAAGEISGIGWWDVLGIAKDAPIDAITASWRTLSRAYHPDTGGELASAENFSQVQGAYRAAKAERGVA